MKPVTILWIILAVVLVGAVIVLVLFLRKKLEKVKKIADTAQTVGSALGIHLGKKPADNEETHGFSKVIFAYYGDERDHEFDEKDGPFGHRRLTIYSRWLRQLFFGLVFLALVGLGIYFAWFTDKLTFFDRKVWYQNLILAGVLLVPLAFALVEFFKMTRHLVFRQSGFDICNVFGKKSYAYAGTRFRLASTIERVSDNDGEKRGVSTNYTKVWRCDISGDEIPRQYILKSSQYMRLWRKITRVVDHLVGIEQDGKTVATDEDATSVATETIKATD